MVIGIYFFKFPNHFAFGGVTGFSTVFSQLLHCSASTFTTAANYALLVLGFIFLGKSVGVRTVYATIVMSVSLQALDALVPMHGTLTDQPMLELVFAIMLPAIGSAILFNIGASSGGTDVIAMILKKYTSMNIGSALMAADVAAVGLSFVMYGPSTGLFSVMGLVAKSMVVDNVIENMNLCKCFNIVCEHPQPICNFIIHELNRSATTFGWIRIPSFHFTNAAGCGRIELRKRRKQRRMASRAGKEGKWKRKCASSMTKWNMSCVQEKFLAILNEY